MQYSPLRAAPTRALALATGAVLAMTSVALASPAQTDDAQIILSIDDVLPTGETVVGISEFRISNEGLWATVVHTNGVPTLGALKEVLVLNGDVVLSEGEVLTSGDTIRGIGSLDMTPDGLAAVLVSVEKAGTLAVAGGVWVGGGDLVIETGPVSGANIPAGTDMVQVLDAEVGPTEMLLMVRLRPPGNVNFDAVLRYDFSVGPTPQITLEAVSGQTVAPFTDPIDSLRHGRNFQLASDGTYTLPMRLDVAGSPLLAGAASGDSVYLEDGPLPVPNFVWLLPSDPEMRASTNGRYAVAGSVRNNMTGQELSVILKNGIPRVVEGAPISGTTGDLVRPFVHPGMSYAETGEVFYEVPLGTATTTLYEVLMADSEELIRTGVSTAGGHTISGFASMFDSVQASPNGKHCLFLADLSASPMAICALERNVGFRPNCVSALNSTGVRGKLRGDGSSLVAANDLLITAYDLPLSSFGYLNTSTTPGFIPNPGGSVGNLCIAGSIGRYIGQVQSSGSTGTIATQVDLTSMPQPTGLASVTAGETWGFQLWHRDASPGGAVSNWTNPRGVLFR